MQTTENKKKDENRAARISRLKKMIVSVFLVLLLVPIILSVVALCKVHSLEQQLKAANQTLQLLTSKINDLYQEQEESGNEETETVSVIQEDVYGEAETVEVLADNSNGMIRVCLTFDDGPSSNTDDILDVLGYYGVQGTFFVNGKPDMADAYCQIVEEGHTLAMHSYSHDYSEIYGDLDSFIDDLDRIQNFLYETTGEYCTYYRFPGGSSNTVSDVEMERCIRYLDACGITYYDWNVDSRDATSGGRTVDQIVEQVISSVSAGDSDTYIVLFHDSADKVTTVEALPIIIEKLMEMDNVIIVPIDEYVTPVQHVTVDVNP